MTTLNVDFVLFRNLTCYTDSPLPCVYVNTTHLLDIMSTLVATYVILGRLECSPVSINWDESTNQAIGDQVSLLHPQQMFGNQIVKRLRGCSLYMYRCTNLLHVAIDFFSLEICEDSILG